MEQVLKLFTETHLLEVANGHLIKGAKDFSTGMSSDSLSWIVVSRFDRLPTSTQFSLKIASTIGR
jgi:hypothetical protein